MVLCPCNEFRSFNFLFITRGTRYLRRYLRTGYFMNLLASFRLWGVWGAIVGLRRYYAYSHKKSLWICRICRKSSSRGLISLSWLSKLIFLGVKLGFDFFIVFLVAIKGASRSVLAGLVFCNYTYISTSSGLILLIVTICKLLCQLMSRYHCCYYCYYFYSCRPNSIMAPAVFAPTVKAWLVVTHNSVAFKFAPAYLKSWKKIWIRSGNIF